MLLGNGAADLLPDRVVGFINLGAQAGDLEGGGHLTGVPLVAVGNRHHRRLHRAEPAGQGPRGVLEEHTEEALHRPE